MSSTADLPNQDVSEEKAAQAALACYLRTVVAVGNAMAEICPPVGGVYRERLLKLPRRLGFDSTPKSLEQSREAVETDLLEYTSTAAAWLQNGRDRASQLLAQLQTTEETLSSAGDLERAFLDDMAEYIQTSAEVDGEAQLRAALARYAAGLRAYSRRAKKENLAAMGGLALCREGIALWLSEQAVSDFTDSATGLLNRAAAERRLHTEIGKQRPFSVIAVGWVEADPIPDASKKACGEQIMKELAERFGATIRPYDLVFRWSEACLVTVFQAPESGIATRARQIAGWLGNPSYSVEIADKPVVVKTLTSVSVVEHRDSESHAKLMERIDAAALQEAVESARS